MSRTKKSKKGPGYEYWSKRPGSKKCTDPGKFGKKVNKRLERIEAKKSIDKNLDENFDDNQDD